MSELGDQVEESGPKLPDQSGKRARFWGAVLIIAAAIIIYAAVLGVATIIVGKQHGMTPTSDAGFRIVFYAALTALCLWTGAKRRPRWASLLGRALAILGVLAFIARFSLARVSPQGAIIGQAMLITAVVLVLAGGACLLWDLAGRRAAG